MNKVISIIVAGAIAATMCITLAACGSKEDSKATEATAPAATAAQTEQTTLAPAADTQAQYDETYVDADTETAYDETYIQPDEETADFIIAIENNDTGDGFSASGENATDRYDTVTAYFDSIPAGSYTVAVYNISPEGISSMCANTAYVNSSDGTVALRVNYYPVVSEVECIEI